MCDYHIESHFLEMFHFRLIVCHLFFSVLARLLIPFLIIFKHCRSCRSKLVYVIPEEWRMYQQRQHQRYYQPSSDL